MAWITDSLRSAIAAVNPFARREEPLPALGAFTHQLAIAAYMSSGMLRKVISIPASDRVREWRDWQAEQDQIAKIEAEERRLQLRAKVKQAEILRGIGGGAMILITAGNHRDELRAETIASGGLVAINVVSRWQIQGVDWVEDLADPAYGTPRMFRINGGTSGQQDIHPSRVVCFRGAPVPAGGTVSTEEAFWGDSQLLRVFTEACRSDETQAWFAALVRKAKLLRVGIPNLSDFSATAEGKTKLSSRIALIAEGESSLNAVVYDAGDGSDKSGEKINDYQITWAGIPAIMDAFDQRVAAVADIPFTRLMGRSPAGMNATGQHDTENWNKMVAAGQELETRPCLEQFDEALIRSAGVDPADVTWRFAPLDTPSEKEQADTFKTTMEAVTALQNTGAIPGEAFAKGLQNLMAEREWMPGLDQALGEIPENERFGLDPEPDDGADDDPSALQAGKEGDPRSAGEGGRSAPRPSRRAANDKAEVGEDAGLPFLDAKRRSKAQRLAGRASASHFDPTQPRGRDGRWIPTGRRQFIDAARAGRPEGHQLIVGKVSARAADRMRTIGLNGAEKSVSLDASNVRHIHKRHGNETRSGHASVRGEDMASAAGILNGARSMRGLAPARTGAPRFATMTNSRGQRVYAVFEVRRYVVALHTMWIRG